MTPSPALLATLNIQHTALRRNIIQTHPSSITMATQTTIAKLTRPITHRYEVSRESRNRYQSHALVLPPNEWERHDPFLLMAEDWFRHPGGFETHPHRGFETVTIIIDGVLQHKDSKGNSGIIHPGGAQWTTIGRGVLHSELPANRETEVHSLQLWLNLPKSAKSQEASYQDIQSFEMPSRDIFSPDGTSAGTLRVISGTSGNLVSRTKNPGGIPIKALDISITRSGVTLVEEFRAEDNLFLYVVSGKATVQGESTEEHTTLLSAPFVAEGSDSSVLTIESVKASEAEPLRIIVFAGKPIGEPVVQRGPFVGNTWEDVLQAQKDYVEGRFYGL
ncbi:RmlC-like cupin domain-containing protein [Endogone sp. FLAS-F59071]|nr:RmlC-like cupin domain-containing protein [Endogone sp. FLAS-F59071]|eukprot:RUS19487.1 RmlC-like cupin domain-containing protein [Endogone sp. FLAS-F59071]